MRRIDFPVIRPAMLVISASAWGVGLWLYESGTPDLGTATAGRAALAADASTAGSSHF